MRLLGHLTVHFYAVLKFITYFLLATNTRAHAPRPSGIAGYRETPAQNVFGGGPQNAFKVITIVTQALGFTIKLCFCCLHIFTVYIYSMIIVPNEGSNSTYLGLNYGPFWTSRISRLRFACKYISLYLHI